MSINYPFSLKQQSQSLIIQSSNCSCSQVRMLLNLIKISVSPMANSCDAALKGVLVLSLLVQGVNLAAGVFIYQLFYNDTFSSSGYWSYVLAASSLSCLFYFALIPMSLRSQSVGQTGFRILLLLTIVLQFGVATVLATMLRNQSTIYSDSMQALENAQSLGYDCSVDTGLQNLCKFRTTTDLSRAATVLSYVISFFATKVIEICSLRALKGEQAFPQEQATMRPMQ